MNLKKYLLPLFIAADVLLVIFIVLLLLPAKTAAPVSPAPSASEPVSAAAEPESPEEPAPASDLQTVRILLPGMAPSDYDDLLAAASETLAAAGLSPEITYLPWDAYEEKFRLCAADGLPFDIVYIPREVFSLQSAEDLLQPLPGDLMTAASLRDAFLPEELAAGTMHGALYGLPAAHMDFASPYRLSYRSDIAAAAGYEGLPDTLDDFFAFMEDAQQRLLPEAGIKPYVQVPDLTATPAHIQRSYKTWPFYVVNDLVLVRQDGTVESYLESEEFTLDAAYYRALSEKKLLDPSFAERDASYLEDQANFGALLPSPVHYEDLQSTIRRNLGNNNITVAEEVLFADRPLLAGSLPADLYALSAAADPALFTRFFSCLYESEENLAAFSELLPLAGFRPVYDKTEGGAVVLSPAAGFVFDESAVQTEATALKQLLASDIYPIKFGQKSLGKYLPSALKKLRKAGLDTYIEAYEKQLSDYLTAK